MDRIRKEIRLNAPRTRVWQALTDAEQFGRWFGADLKDKTFAAGQRTAGQITLKGYEHVAFDVVVERIEPETLFSFRWHPYAVDPKVDYSKEPRTLVAFELEESGGGTLLRVVESGFENLPALRRNDAFRMNSGGWEAQLVNISQFIGEQHGLR